MLRALLLVVHLAWGLILATRLAFGGSEPRERLAQRWHRRLLAILGLRLRVEGLPLRDPHITVANHVSWLDIPVLGALEPTRFVGKSEIRDWPVAGWLATAAGTFFLRRGSGGTGPLLDRLVPHLRARGSVVIFPEGTTTDGSEVRPFHARLFGAAVVARCPVQPVTIRYGVTPRGRQRRAVHRRRLARRAPPAAAAGPGPGRPRAVRTAAAARRQPGRAGARGRKFRARGAAAAASAWPAGDRHDPAVAAGVAPEPGLGSLTPVRRATA